MNYEHFASRNIFSSIKCNFSFTLCQWERYRSTQMDIIRFEESKLCVNSKYNRNISFISIQGVRLGEWDQSTNPDCEDSNCADAVVDIPVIERTPHENYVPTSRAQENDIALLRLARPVAFTDWIRPICLPVANSNRNINYENTDAAFVVAGWGKVSITAFCLNLCNNSHTNSNRVFFHLISLD